MNGPGRRLARRTLGRLTGMQEESDRAAVALGHAREAVSSANTALARQAAEQAAVARLGLRALHLDDSRSVRDEILRSARELLGADCVALYEWKLASGELRRSECDGELVPHEWLGLVLPEDPLLRICAEGRLLVPEWSRMRDTSVLQEPAFEATVAVQMAERGETFGILAVHFRAPRQFGPGEVNTLQALANLLAGSGERERVANEMLWRALHDPLTELPNRVLFVDRLAQAIAAAPRRGRSVGVLFLDLDHFKFVNDSLGHSAGDELLRQIADRLRDTMRAGDTVARFGGDEFLLICENLRTTEEGVEIAQRLIEALGQPISLAGQRHHVSASIGIAIAADSDRDPEDLIREADAAMYEAKEKGRDGYAVYDEVMRARASQRLTTEHELRRALDQGELRLVYQPVVSLPSNEMQGVEALLRWQHPERGLIMPEHFIQVAEQSGLIVPMGRWVLGEALRQAAAWRRRFPGRRLPVAVNLSAREVTHSELLAAVTAQVAKQGLPADLLELEITESVLMDPAETSMESLAALREMGARIVLDDFGTGYSSLAYVKHFPIDGLKIDRSFVREMVAASADASIVEAVIAMARGLRLGVVAEGVETLEQAELLEDMGCVRCQGFAYSPGVPAEEIDRLLAQGELAFARPAASAR